jgi:hypothetical protein
MHLMLRLRESEASRYTERDTPIFVGALTGIRAALDQLDGTGSGLALHHDAKSSAAMQDLTPQ